MAFRSATVRRERTVFYDSRRTSVVVGGLGLTFYPGQPQQANRRATIVRITPLTLPSENSQPQLSNSYLQQVLLGENLTSDLTNGIGPIRLASCVEPTIVRTEVPIFADETIIVPVVYASPAPTTDIGVLFLPRSASVIRATSFVQTGPSSADVVFPFSALFPTGSYTFKIMRGATPFSCFSVRPGAVVLLP